MSGHFEHVPLDHPYLGRFHEAHVIDRNPETTVMAIGIVNDAVAAGHPDDGSAAARVMTGASGAAHVQAVIQPYLDEAIDHDKTAEVYSTEAVQFAQQAQSLVEQYRDLPKEAVQLSDGSSMTRGQVRGRHDQILTATTQREGRGDFEHNARPPGLLTRLIVVTVLSLIEVFLLIWPVTDATWSDPKSVAYVIGLVVLFLFVNENLPRLCGLAAREAREVVHAAWELTRVGLSASLNGRPDAGRETIGHVDERPVHAAKRKRMRSFATLGVVLAIYSAVMFTRVERLAAGLGWPLLFVLLSAALITMVTTGSALIMTGWWSRGNGLGDQLREHGAITGESRAIAEDLADQFREHERLSDDAADHVHRELDLGEQKLHDGYQTVGIGLQKAAKILDQESIPVPRPENLFAAGRPIRRRATANVFRAQTILAKAHQIMAGASPFGAAAPAPNPWEFRTAPRQALANPAFLDSSQLGTLHTADAMTVPAFFREHWFHIACVIVVLALVTTAVLIYR